VAIRRTYWLLLSMVLTVVVVGTLTYLEEQDRSESGLDDLGNEQAAVARVAGLLVTNALGSGSTERLPQVAAKLRELELDNARVFFVSPDAEGAQLFDGRVVQINRLPDAIARGERFLRLSREDAAKLGLPARAAMAGIARLPGGWSVGVVATAEHQRDRDRAGMYRTLLATALAVGIVTAFGTVTLARQRKQLDLERELAIADLSHAKDGELERLSRSATMAALGSGVAHELSTPLGVIVGRAEQLLSRSAGDERAEKAAQAILDQADHIDRVVRGLLGLARGAPIALQEIEPGQLVRDAADLVEHRYSRAGVKLVCDVSPSLPTVRCEPLLFKHALINLLLNACDASRSGDVVRIEVRADPTEIAFIVSDDGEGITQANAARAVAPFFTTKPSGHGTGLGLAIANEIASTHRGSLAIAPKTPRGTRACVRIPTNAVQANG
jgi:signal transduction histidine kinase